MAAGISGLVATNIPDPGAVTPAGTSPAGVVPEPAGWMLVGAGAVGALAARRRRLR